MAQTVPLAAELGPAQTGLTIEYQIYDIDGTTIDTTWTSSGMAETDVPGTYRKAGGISVDDAGAYVIFRRTSDNAELAFVTVEPASPTVTQITSDIDNNSSQLSAIVGDTNELQTDWADGGRLDLILDARASQSSVDTVDTVADAIKAVTDNLPDAGALTTIDSNIDAILADTGTDGVVVASHTTAAKAEINTEVLDVLTTDTFAEPGAVPAATSSLKDKINWLFALARNKITQTATTQTLRNDADDADIATSTVSDDGTTFTRGEWS